MWRSVGLMFRFITWRQARGPAKDVNGRAEHRRGGVDLGVGEQNPRRALRQAARHGEGNCVICHGVIWCARCYSILYVRHGMGWDGMGRNGIGWDGTEWDGTEWDGMGWDGMGWDEMGLYLRALGRYFALKRQNDKMTNACLLQHNSRHLSKQKNEVNIFSVLHMRQQYLEQNQTHKTTRTEQSTSRITPPKVDVSMPHATQTIFDRPCKVRRRKERQGEASRAVAELDDELLRTVG